MAKILSVSIDDEVQKALEWGIADLDIFIDNFVRNRARQNSDEICKLAIEDKTGTILSSEDRQALKTYLDNQDIDILTSIKQLPNNVKREIVKRANIQSAAEREAERVEP